MKDEKDPKTEVNPAARHDPPEPPPSKKESREGEQVKPAQEEPLDPLSPGGIGS